MLWGRGGAFTFNDSSALTAVSMVVQWWVIWGEGVFTA